MPDASASAGRLTTAQIDHFETFGFLLLRQAFSPAEMEHIVEQAEVRWSELRGADPQLSSTTQLVEERPSLAALITDNRIYQPMAQLLGADFIWNGSEYHDEEYPTAAAHHWHADRPGPREASYRRIKIMFYLEPKRRNEGALRVIPGSHRDPLHSELLSFQLAHVLPDPSFFDLDGRDVPCFALETSPGDVALFSQSLYHAVYGKLGRRRYLGLKFAARPTTDEHLASLRRTTSAPFEPHPIFLDAASPRLARMVEGLPQQAGKAQRLTAQYTNPYAR